MEFVNVKFIKNGGLNGFTYVYQPGEIGKVKSDMVKPLLDAGMIEEFKEEKVTEKATTATKKK